MDKRFWLLLLVACFSVSACQPIDVSQPVEVLAEAPPASQEASTPQPTLTLFPTRPVFAPGELVDYIAQTGDSLPVLAVRFNTTEAEIRAANPFIPESVTTMPPGMPMKIPIYYAPLWGSSYQILPDSHFINGPAQVEFSSTEYLGSVSGWLSGYREYASGENRSAAQIIDLVAANFSVSPRLLIAMLEYAAGGVTQPEVPPDRRDYPLGIETPRYRGLYLQLIQTSNMLNQGYYSWRLGNLITIELRDGKVERFDPWQNAASVALHYFYAAILSPQDYQLAISSQGLALTYQNLFGDPWITDAPHLPGSLQQPAMTLPFAPGNTWAFTGGPHTAWGDGQPFSALDFAPGLETGGCTPTDLWAVAVADGVVARSEPATVVLDLDGDGDERTGWAVFYFHIATEGRVPSGTVLRQGDPIGHPSCEGGRATGTHVHIARKYNGEWIPAGGVLAFNLDGWVAEFGARPYEGTLRRFSQVVTACSCSDASSQLEAGGQEP